ncbi:MAG: MBL fold metallo-hydrolase [Gemmatimonadales bacterium]|nr:MBL fold metallo-hydrolase [Gemmatimonadales bacterium]
MGALPIRSALLVGVVAVSACRAEPRDRGTTSGSQAAGTYLVLLGTGTPNAEPDRSGPALAVVARETAYLVDAGPGVVRRAAAAASRHGLPALEAGRLDRVFLTHLHSDHTLGLPDLLLTPWVLERARKLDVYGPHGTRPMIDHLLAAYDADVRRRIDGLQPQFPDGYGADVHEIEPGVIYRDSNVTVTAFAVDHEEWPQAFGFRFDTPDGVIVISGDARPSASVVQACDRCDILVHEVYSDAGFARRSAEWRAYHASAHTSASELAGLASRAQPGLLVLTHQLSWGTSPEDLVAEVRAGYQGRVVSGYDLDLFHLPTRR